MTRVNMVSQILSWKISHPVHWLPGQVCTPGIRRAYCIQVVVLQPLSLSIFPQASREGAYPSLLASNCLFSQHQGPHFPGLFFRVMSLTMWIRESFRSFKTCHPSASGTEIFLSYLLSPFLPHHIFPKLHSLIYHNLSPSSQFLLCILPNFLF